jgi:hypothetical protein
MKFSVGICELVGCTMKTLGFFSNMCLGVNILQRWEGANVPL